MKLFKTILVSVFIISAFAARAQVPDLGLLAWYEFSGDTRDSSINGNDAVAYGPVLTEDRLGHPDSAYFFDGDHDFIKANPSESFRVNDELTISAWVNFVDWGDAHFVAVQGTHFDTTGNWEFSIRATGQIMLVANNQDHWPHFGELIGPRSVSSVPFGEWHHICATFNSGRIRFYIDGALDNEVNYAVHYFRNTNDGIKIGEKEHAPGSADAYGAIDEVMIYNRCLEDSEVQNIFFNGSNRHPTITGPTALEGTELSLLTATYDISDEDGNLANVYTSNLPEGASFVPYAGAYHFYWTPSISQAGDYGFTIYAEDEAGATTEQVVTVHIDEKLTYDQLTEAQAYVLSIPNEFFGDKPNRQDNNRRFFLKDLSKIAENFVDGKLDPAFSQLLKLMKFCDNGLLGISGNNTDFIVAGEYQKTLFKLLADIVKNITFRSGAFLNPTEPIILVHGFLSDADTWDEFIRYSGLIDGGIVTVTMDDNQNVDLDESRLIPNVSGTNFLVYRIELKDGFGKWGDRTLEEQGTMVFVATEAIKTHSGFNEFVFLGHSMGGLSIKSYLHYLDGGDSATGYMTIGTPHWGTPYGTTTSLGEFAAAEEMAFFSDQLSELGNLGESDLQFTFAFATDKNETPLNPFFSSIVCLKGYLSDCMDDELIAEFFTTFRARNDGVVPVWSQRSYWCEQDINSGESYCVDVMPNETIPGSIGHTKQTKNPDVINRILYEYWLRTR